MAAAAPAPQFAASDLQHLHAGRAQLEESARARFLDQLEVSPYRAEPKRRLSEQGDPLVEQAAAADVAARLVDVPMEVLHVLAFGSLVRLVATGVELSDVELDRVADAGWRAITGL